MAERDEIASLRALVAQLTERVYRLEQMLAVEPPPRAAEPPATRVPSTEPVVPAQVVLPPPPLGAVPGLEAAAPPPRDRGDLESRIGSQWLNRIGIVATLVGISYFLKYAFENNWIGPAGRVAIGLLAGIAVVGWSERFRAKGYAVFSWSLKAVGIGAMYLSLWAAFQLYSLMPSLAAFFAMVLVTAFTATLALRQDAEVLAALALLGGFLTPVLVSTHQNKEVELLSYLALLDIATVVLQTVKPWRRLVPAAYVGTQLLFWLWYASFYGDTMLVTTAGFATLFFCIFVAAPLVAKLPQSGEIAPSIAIVPLVNAGVFFLTLYVLLEDKHHDLLAWIAVALAAVYLVLARQIEKRGVRTSGTVRLLDFIYIALAVGFLTTAIPLKLSAQWITFGWLVESAVLFYAAYRLPSDFLKALSVVALVLGVLRLAFYDSGQVSTLIVNSRFALYLVAIVAVAWAVYLSRNDTGENVETGRAIGVVAINILALTALSLEVHDYFQQQIDAAYKAFGTPVRGQYSDRYYREFAHLNRLRGFAYSAVWMAYGAVLMWVGFVRRSAFLRWQALLLLAITIVKVFVYDTSQLETPYRVLSFIALGVILLAVSFAYQRDWLKLNVRREGGSA